MKQNGMGWNGGIGLHDRPHIENNLYLKSSFYGRHPAVLCKICTQRDT